MTDEIAYFGYGSLVNRNTHRTDIVRAHRARLHGWRRFWRPRPDVAIDAARARPVSLLTVHRQADAVAEGLLVVDTAENLPAVDLRETGYDRQRLDPAEIDLIDGATLPDCPLYVYEARPAHEDDGQTYPVFQSYLDAVLQGFLTEHGEAGARRFVFETAAFDVPVLSDRNRPFYPRAVSLTQQEAAIFDALLAERGVRFIAP